MNNIDDLSIDLDELSEEELTGVSGAIFIIIIIT